MTHSTDIAALARWMAADFSNQEQAIENPPFYAHIRVCMRPVSLGLSSGVSLFLEQAYDYMLNNPYRLRVLNLRNAQNHIILENYTVKEEQRFYGASRNLERLKTLSASLKYVTLPPFLLITFLPLASTGTVTFPCFSSTGAAVARLIAPLRGT